MRFIHSADWQIGMAAAQVGEAGVRVRQARLEAARRVCDLVRSESADFLVLAGDTFEHNGVDRELITQIAAILRPAGRPVYLIPGNHDPLLPGSVWEHPAWQSASNVHILRDCQPISIPGGTLFPCPLLRKRSHEDPTLWIGGASTGQGIRIGIAHGTVGELGGEGGYPIAFDAATRLGLDYLALGHWHSTTLFTVGGATRMAYSGTPEASGFGEPDSGNSLIVDIELAGAAPVVRKARTGALEWQKVDQSITGPGALAELTRRLAAVENPSQKLIAVTLTGLLFQRDCDELDRMRKSLSHFLFGRLDAAALRPAPADSEWVNALPLGLVRQTAERLRELANGSGSEAATATQALIELYALAGAEVHA
jgi:DNA repair exonuclease SbcCD nuclease subunit